VARPKLKIPPSAATSQYPPPSGVAAIPTIGAATLSPLPLELVVLVNANTAGGLTPATMAVTMYPPVWVLAVKVEATAILWLSVVAVAMLVPPGKVPLGPLVGAANVTSAPETGILLASLPRTHPSRPGLLAPL